MLLIQTLQTVMKDFKECVLLVDGWIFRAVAVVLLLQAYEEEVAKVENNSEDEEVSEEDDAEKDTTIDDDAGMLTCSWQKQLYRI